MSFWSRLANFVSGRSGWKYLFPLSTSLQESPVPMQTAVNPVSDAEVDLIRLTSPGRQTELIFRKVPTAEWDTVPQVTLAPASLHEWNQLVSGLLTSGLSPGSFSGVFVATAPVSDLMRLSSGGYGSAVIGAGGIERQAGFIPISATAFAPLVAFEALSIVTGQYFLHQISVRLQSIEDSLSELARLLHSEKIGELRQAEHRIRSLLGHTTVVPEDLIEIRLLSNQVGAIAAQYLSVINGLTARVSYLTESAARGITTTMSGALAKSLSSRRDFLCMRIAIKATELHLVSRLTQLALVIRRSQQDASRISEITELRQNVRMEIAAFEEQMIALTHEIREFFAYFRTEGGKLKTWVPLNGKRAEKILAYVEAESDTMDRLLFETASTLVSVKDRYSEIEQVMLSDRPARIALRLEAGRIHSIKIGKVLERVEVPAHEARCAGAVG